MKRISKFIALMAATSLVFTGCSVSIQRDDGQKADSQSEVSAAEESDNQEAEKEAETEAVAEEEVSKDSAEDIENETADATEEEVEEYVMPDPICFLKNTVTYNDANGKNSLICTGEKDKVAVSPAKLIDFGHGADEYKDLADSIDMVMKMVDASFDNSYDDVKEMAEEEGSNWLPYFNNSKISIPRADTLVTSLMVVDSMFAGGAHGSEVITTYVFDSETGKELRLKDIVKDTKKLPDIIKKGIDPSVDLMVEDAYFEEAVKEDKLNFIVDNCGLTIYFNQYDIAPYADGIITVCIPFFNNEDLFVGKYANTMPGYAAHLVSGAPYVDYTVDNYKVVPLNVYSVTDGNGGPVTSIEVNAGKYTDTQEIEKAQYVEYTFFRAVDYGCYLYAEVTGMDGAMSTYVWVIDSGNPGISFVDKLDNTCAPMYSSEIDGQAYFELLTHPEAMVVEKAGRQEEMFVGENGVPTRVQNEEE